MTTADPGDDATTADPGDERSVAEAMAKLLGCPDPQSLLTTAMDVWLTGVGASSGLVHLLQDDGWMRMAMGVGYPEEALDSFRLIPPDAEQPLVRVARTRVPEHVLAAEYRDLFPVGVSPRRPTSFSVLPLLVDDRCLGTLMVQLDRLDPLSGVEEHELTLITTVCAHRLDHLLSMGTGAESDERLDQALRLIQGRSRAARLELAMTNAEIGSFDWDFASGKLIWDDRICRLFGLEPEEFDERHETFIGAIHPDDREQVEELLERTKETGIYRGEYRVVWPDGSVHWIAAGGKVVYDTQGRPMGMLGVAQDRTEQRRNEELSAARQQFILDVSRAFSDAMSTQSVIEKVYETVLPGLGGSSTALYVSERTGMHLVGTRGLHGESLRRLERLTALDAGHPLQRELRMDRPMFFGDREALTASVWQPDLVPEEEVQASALLPLTTGEDLVGIWVVNYSEPHEFTPEVQVAHTAAAGILGQSLARAEQFDARRRQMNELQQLMLPRTIPDVPRLEAAVRYLPGSQGLHVGGDWYDILSMPGGRVTLAIGDVQGHSAEAAAVMGQLRTSMWAHAKMGPTPTALMQLGNHTLADLDTELFATSCLIELDPVSGDYTAVRAGHPYPLVVHPDGRVHELEVPGGLPLGTFADSEYPDLDGTLPPGAILLLFTDGLVERRDADYTEAVYELMHALAQWTRERPPDGDPDGDGPEGRRTVAAASGEGGPAQSIANSLSLDALADLVVTPALSRSSHDDIAVLLVRRTS
ncbi:SpoIIE family protein phosphatase [Streptomyces sp. NA04227]|uniref:SpoIIE family protein phosphatase n=1 Tax=Streptomyces sp. NA04227 TaxID=2742136 RepID=UPI001590DFAC|nr:SpoIIE family protein phosphatase [Streptomyces sp. NA04227]QKW06529.1 SpoIIE family protein phosphatase [Streptomyces sp. NA04227]